jgi:hypothetical protein
MPTNPNTAETEENPYRPPLAVLDQHSEDGSPRLGLRPRIFSVVLFTCASVLALCSLAIVVAAARLDLVGQIPVAIREAVLAAIFIAIGVFIRRKG